MAHRRQKRRTHIGAKNGASTGNPKAANPSAARTPKSMVIRIGAGEVGSSVSQLVKDFRQLMEPHTASRLRERRSNRLRDYTTMAGPLGVSHLLLFSKSSSGNVNLRLALTPRGPTMTFRVDNYSLCKDVKRAMKRPTGTSNEFTAPPLLVMNNFATPKDEDSSSGVPRHLESLSTSVFQSLFPAISPATTPLHSIQRVLLLNRERSASSDPSKPSYVLNLRHYAITTKKAGLPKAIRRINAAEKVLTDNSKRRPSIPNLGKLTDMADYMLDSASAGGFTSGSESEPETDAEVEMLESQTKKVQSRKRPSEAALREEKAAKIEKRAIKLSELGPRLKLRLVKVEEGVCTGKVMWHEFIKKTRDEERLQDKTWEENRQLKEERKKLQKENLEKKKHSKDGERGKEDEADDLDDDWDSEDFEDEDLMDHIEKPSKDADQDTSADGTEGGNNDPELATEDEMGED